jgi:hypothetical protein
MKTLLTFSLLALFATAHAQTRINETPNPCHGCWGINSIPVLSDSDRVALRLYRPEAPLKWHDFKTYRFKGQGKRAVWISYTLAGILHGGREAYHAESTVFEKRFNASPLSFFGSEQWKRNYFDRDPDNGHKPNLFNPVRDYYHFSGAATKAIWIGGAFTIGMGKQPMKYKLLDLMIGTLITSGSASLTYNLLR